MMDNGAAKRVRVSTKEADSLTVCNNCGQLSSDLYNCEHCGCPLSGNGLRPAQKNARVPALNGSAVPTPQSLYYNKNIVTSTMPTAAMPIVVTSTGAGRSQVRPQQLYVNINNPIATPAIASNSALPSASPTVTPPANTYDRLTVRGTTVSSGGVATVLNNNQTTLSLVSTAPDMPAFQPPPPYTPTMLGVGGPLANVLPSTGGVAPVVKISSSAPALIPSVAAPPEVSITAYQIRIGTHKFLPISPVTFKDDGILFTLKGYTHAPVLLNARAIMICKANLIFDHYPVIFLYLESSCMRQIRSIFTLKEEEFSDSGYPLKRCITIFPNASASQIAEQATSEAIVAMFSSMSRKYPTLSRSKILYLLSPEHALDMLLALPSREKQPVTEASHSTAQLTQMTIQAAPRAVMASQPVRQPMVSTAQPAVQATHQSNQISTTSTSHGNLVVTQQKAAPYNVATGNSGASPPLLQVPSDMSRWREMQKSLVVGGVYHAQMPSGLVQNTEVLVDCSHARIGNYTVKCVGQLRVKADPPSGIYFSFQCEEGTKNIFLSQNEISYCLICVDAGLGLIFIYTTPAGASNIRHRCKLSLIGSRLTYNPKSTDESEKHIVLYLKSLNADQTDALMQMKCPGHVTKRMFDNIPTIVAYKTLLKLSSVAEPSSGLLPTRLKELVGKVISEADGKDATEDDDDDDVIMTSEEVGMKCPYTQQVMKEPTRNKVCGHNYERAAIVEFIMRKKGNAKCPYAGCGNITPLQMQDLEPNSELKAHIAGQEKADKT